MPDIFRRAKLTAKRLIPFNGLGLEIGILRKPGYLNMAAESHYLFTDFILKSCEDCNGDEHDGGSQGDSGHGNNHEGPRKIGFAVRNEASCQKKFSIQGFQITAPAKVTKFDE